MDLIACSAVVQEFESNSDGEGMTELSEFGKLLVEHGWLDHAGAQLVSAVVRARADHIVRIRDDPVEIGAILVELLQEEAPEAFAQVTRAFFQRFCSEDLKLPRRLVTAVASISQDAPFQKLEATDLLLLTDPIEMCELMNEWILSDACDARLGDITVALQEHLQELVDRRVSNENAVRAAYTAISMIKLDREALGMMFRGDLIKLANQLLKVGGDVLAGFMDKITGDLQQEMDNSVKMAMRAEEIVHRADSVIALITDTSIVQDGIEFAAQVFDKVPIVGELVKVFNQFYQAAKGAQYNQAECAEFLEQIRFVDKLVEKASQGTRADEMESLRHAKNIISEAAQFVETLQGKGFWRRVISSHNDDRKLKQLSEKLKTTVQNMLAELQTLQISTGQPLEQDALSVFDPSRMAKAVRIDQESSELLLERMDALKELFGPHDSLLPDLIHDAIEAQQLSQDTDATSSMREQLKRGCQEIRMDVQQGQEALVQELRQLKREIESHSAVDAQQSASIPLEMREFMDAMKHQMDRLLSNEARRLSPDFAGQLEHIVASASTSNPEVRKIAEKFETFGVRIERIGSEAQRAAPGVRRRHLPQRHATQERPPSAPAEPPPGVGFNYSPQRHTTQKRSPPVPAEPPLGVRINDSRYKDEGLLRQGGLHSVRRVLDTVKNTRVAAKVFADDVAFRTEWKTLQQMNDAGGRDYVIELNDVDEAARTLYLEMARCSVDQRLAEKPDGFEEFELRPYVIRVLDILDYLHNSKKVVHNDVKIENLLVCESGFSDKLKIADLENASPIGAPRSQKCTAYICPPELAQAICSKQSLRVKPSEDVWAIGVMVLRLMGHEAPFTLGNGDDSASKLAPLASLTDTDVRAVVERANVQIGSQLYSFLVGDSRTPGCLAVRPEQRAKIQDLRSKGWISGNAVTQVHRDGVGHVRDSIQAMDVKLDSVAEGVQRIEGAILDMKERIEVVRKTIVNLDSEQVPLVFTLSLGPPNGTAPISDDEAKGLFGRFSQILQKHNPLTTVRDHLDALKGQKVNLRLLCQYPWEPVGEGYEIRAPRQEVPPLLPLLSVGVKGLQTVNTAAAVANLFLGGVLPGRIIPASVIRDAESLADGIPEGLHSYPSVVELAGQVALQGETATARQALSHYQQQQFKQFLRTHDPEGHWRGHLRRVPLADGTVLWVSEAGLRQLEAEGMLDNEGAKLQQELEERIRQARQQIEGKLETELAKKEAAMQQQMMDAEAAATETEQEMRDRTSRVEAELQRLKDAHSAERKRQEDKADDARRQLAQLQQEKWAALLDDANNPTALMGSLAEEHSSVAARMHALAGEEKVKLRQRLEEKQRQRANELLKREDVL